MMISHSASYWTEFRSYILQVIIIPAHSVSSFKEYSVQKNASLTIWDCLNSSQNPTFTPWFCNFCSGKLEPELLTIPSKYTNMSRRPEHQAPPEVYYGIDEAQKYTQNTRIIEVQEKCSERAVELLALPDDTPALLLDVGCGSGLSGETLTSQGHMWVGMDISSAMLDVAVERELEGDLMLGDMGQGMPFRPGMFDGAISISAVQWLCYADTKLHKPGKRLYKLFMTLYACLSRGSRAVFQFYPENDAQVELIVSQAMRAGFTGGLVVDFPNSTKAKKIYLVLMTGGASQLPKGLQDQEETTQTQALYQRREHLKAIRHGKLPRYEWIMKKKERRRKQGKEVKGDSKYTGRKRSGRF